MLQDDFDRILEDDFDHRWPSKIVVNLNSIIDSRIIVRVRSVWIALPEFSASFFRLNFLGRSFFVVYVRLRRIRYNVRIYCSGESFVLVPRKIVCLVQSAATHTCIEKVAS